MVNDWDFSEAEDSDSFVISKPDVVVNDKNESTDSSDTILVLNNLNLNNNSQSLVTQTEPVNVIKNKTENKKGKANKQGTVSVTVEHHDSSRDSLDNLSAILLNFPQTNPFNAFSFPDPLNPDHMLYHLPPYMKIYLQTLLIRLNDHLPPSSLAVHLQPFIQFDTTTNKYIAIDTNLNLIILQKLDFLMNKEKEPNFLSKAFNSLKKRRAQSN